ncbi:MAG: hypothetical protein QOF51_404 [Chloroflexota bacterium]|nr:hypothetical protein [Chloroflexota bacterium]
MVQEYDPSAESIGNVVLMEHLNVTVPDQLKATVFYIVGLGFTRDPYNAVAIDNMHVNVGQQQFHLPTRGVQVVPGHVGLVVPSLDQLRERLKYVAEPLQESEFGWSDEDGYVSITCPWGNQFRAYEPSERFGTMKLGIPYIALEAPTGSAAGIARFYDRVMGAPSMVAEHGGYTAAHVTVGRNQTLVFQETASDLPPYAGYHVAVYIADFARPYNHLRDRGLADEVRNHQFRFSEIRDPDTEQPVFTLEHEVRNVFHPNFGVPLINRTPQRVGR